MAGGVFAVARNIFEHELFDDEPFTQREAWLWLIREAAWKERRVRVGKKLCAVKRGQLATSMRFMADKWQWSEAKVRRFLKKLKSDAMVEVVSDALATQITICNYDEYQRVSLPGDAASDAVTDAAATQQRRKQEDRGNQGNTGKKEGERASAPAEYAFVGNVIRLKQEQFEQWETTFWGIPDMPAELAKADAYYTENPPQGGKWFFPVSRWLEREHRKAAEARAIIKDWRKDPLYAGVL